MKKFRNFYLVDSGKILQIFQFTVHGYLCKLTGFKVLHQRKVMFFQFYGTGLPFAAFLLPKTRKVLNIRSAIFRDHGNFTIR
jgi:hypothetical protein